MNSTASSELKSGKKRVSANIATSSNIISKRASHLSSNIASYYKKFPEMNYIVDSTQMQARVGRGAVEKFLEAKRAKKCKEELIPLNSLPDEVLQNCLSYVGKGHYGLVALTSKKFRRAYTAAFIRRASYGGESIYFGRETAYFEMATSVNLANHCFNQPCKSLEEKVELLKAAAVNGNLDILRAAVENGHDLSPFIEMKKKTIYECYDGSYMSECENELSEEDFEEFTANYYYTDDGAVKISKLVARGHLHVLKYLHEELNFHEGLQRYVKPAIQYGKVEILEWLKDIGCMDSNHKMFRFYHEPYQSTYFSHYGYLPFHFCDHAVKFGDVQILQWLLNQGHDFGDRFPVMYYAISSESLDMVHFCSDKGYDINAHECGDALRPTCNIELYRLLHDLGFEFRKGMKYFFRDGRNIAQQFDIIRFLRSISVPWDRFIMEDIVQYGTQEMIQYAREDGCPWTTSGDA